MSSATKSCDQAANGISHPFPRMQAEGTAKLAWDQEELSLHGLSVLLKQAIEGISFMLLLNDYKLPDIVARWVDSFVGEGRSSQC